MPTSEPGGRVFSSSEILPVCNLCRLGLQKFGMNSYVEVQGQRRAEWLSCAISHLVGEGMPTSRWLMTWDPGASQWLKTQVPATDLRPRCQPVTWDPGASQWLETQVPATDCQQSPCWQNTHCHLFMCYRSVIVYSLYCVSDTVNKWATLPTTLNVHRENCAHRKLCT